MEDVDQKPKWKFWSVTKRASSSNTALDQIEDKKPERDTWNNQCEFFLSCLGFAVGFGNLWRFPYLCFKNGGAVFLIPYFTMLLVAGTPLFFMELALGQYVSLGPNILFPKMVPIFSGVGWSMLATTAMVTIYYNMVFAWSVYYTFSSFTSTLPWSTCDNDFNSENCFTYEQVEACQNQSLYYYNKRCLDIGQFCAVGNKKRFNSTHCYDTVLRRPSKAEEAVIRMSSSEDYYKNKMLGVTGATWENMGTLKWDLVGCLALAWVIVAICMIKGVKSTGRVVYFTALFPYVVLIILFVRGVTLDGAYDGICFYILNIDFAKLMDIGVWNDAATQIFFSLSVGYGGLITLSSYSKFNTNCMRDAIVISFANCATSVFAGFAIFSILGFMAKEIGVEVTQVVQSGSGLAFVAYPLAVSMMPIPPLWSILFFVMFITLGVDSQFTFVETLSTGIFDQFESTRRRKPIVIISLCSVMFLAGLTLCLNGGVYMFELLNYYPSGISVLFIALCEVLCVTIFYGFRRFMANIAEMGIHVPWPLYIYWTSTWLFLTPVSLLLLIAIGIYDFKPLSWGKYLFPANIQMLGWFTTAASMGCIPIFAVWKLVRNKKSFRDLFRPKDSFCPAYLRTKIKVVKEAPVFSVSCHDNPAFSEETQSHSMYPTLPRECHPESTSHV